MTPVSERDGMPVFDGSKIRVGRLLLHLTANPPTIPLPCYIECGESTTRIDPENAQMMALGMLLAFEMEQSAKDE